MTTISGNPIDGYKKDFPLEPMGSNETDPFAIQNDHKIPIVIMCIWVLHDAGQWGIWWESGCNEDEVDSEDDEGPLQWGWRFCPYCGFPIAQKITGEGN